MGQELLALQKSLKCPSVLPLVDYFTLEDGRSIIVTKRPSKTLADYVHSLGENYLDTASVV